MVLSSFRRSGRLRRSILRPVLLLCGVLFMLDLLMSMPSSPPIRVGPSANIAQERVFIASMHWNNEAIIRSAWSDSVVDLVHQFGKDNVYISILEGGSWDGTRAALEELDGKLEILGVNRTLVFDSHSHKDEISRTPEEAEEGWILTSRGRKELRRIPYLAKIRNRVMEPFFSLANGPDAQKFDKILWLNDVAFVTEDITTLMATRDGDYASTCSLDFSKPPFYYDTFALRDILGAKAITQTWPYFLAPKSRSALMDNKPVPVQSCWNGIVVLQAQPFYNNSDLKFRGIQDSLSLQHLEASECCLIHADNPLSAEKGVWLNPNVRVGYNSKAYEDVNPESRLWPSSVERIIGLWSNRVMRCFGLIPRILEEYRVSSRLNQWISETETESSDRYEAGKHCLINEMQVLIENGWAHV